MKNTYNLKNVEFIYSNQKSEGDEFKLGPLNFSIKSNKISFILGRSGSGKSTLLSLLGLLRYRSKGEMFVADNEISSKWYERESTKFRLQNIGFALQKGELLPYLTLEENSKFILDFARSSLKESHLHQVFENLYPTEKKQNQLSRLLSSKPSFLSQGQYQRGALARRLLIDLKLF